MPTVTLTDPVAATVITAGLHTANNAALRAALNAGLDTANWASGRIFAPSKLMQEGATKFQGLRWNGSDWVPANTPQIYGTRLAAAVDVNTTVVETTIYSQVITGGDLGTNRRLVPYGSGDFLHNNVAGDTVTLRFKFGGTTFATLTNSLGGTLSATRRPWSIAPHLSFIANELATNVQQASVDVVGNLTDGTVYGLGLAALTTMAIDTTADQTFAVTAQWSASSVNNSWKVSELFLLLY